MSKSKFHPYAVVKCDNGIVLAVKQDMDYLRIFGRANVIETGLRKVHALEIARMANKEHPTRLAKKIPADMCCIARRFESVRFPNNLRSDWMPNVSRSKASKKPDL